MAKPIRETTTQKKRELPLELLYDLVFVFSVAQCAEHLWEHQSLRGAAEALVLLLASLSVWSLTSWVVIITGAEKPPARWMMLGMMLPALFLNASVTKAFIDSGWAFAIPFLLMHTVRIFYAMTLAPLEDQREHYRRVLIWFVVSAPLWMVGAAAGREDRLMWWALAVGWDFLGTWLAHPVPWRILHSRGVPFDADHMLERCRQFLIVALGETVVSTALAVSQQPVDGMTLATGTAALVGTVSIWMIMFGQAHRSIMRHLEKTQDPVRSARFANNSTMVIVAGLLMIAVGNKQVVLHPTDGTGLSLSLMLAGGPLLFFAAQGWYLWWVPRVSPRLQLMGGAMLVVAGFVALALPAYGALTLVSACLAGLAFVDKK